MALESTQPVTEMSTRRISWGKCGRCVWLTTLPLSCAVVMKSGKLNLLEPSGPLQTCNGTDLPLQHICNVTFLGYMNQRTLNVRSVIMVDNRACVDIEFFFYSRQPTC